jgi:hypothetical protein
MTKRRKADISEEPKNRRQSYSDVSEFGVLKPADLRKPQSIPTGNPRHCTAVRLGRISGEVFQRSRVQQIPLDNDLDIWGKDATTQTSRKKTENQEQETAEVRVRGAGEKGSGTKAGSSKSGAQRKGVQASASASKAKARKKAVKRAKD